ncbi:MAG: hypothetical protein Q7T81_10445, partial [Pseudolabrys sp.]|nr:hypothetical protein [Pseudolabrys sp.]
NREIGQKGQIREDHHDGQEVSQNGCKVVCEEVQGEKDGQKGRQERQKDENRAEVRIEKKHAGT